jgi:uncharacterized phage-associated protein
MKALDIANYFLSLTNEEYGDGISNLKMQKLLFYAQGFHLAFYNKPLFNEKIEAWMHGPVVPDLYHHYKHNVADALPKPKKMDFKIYSQDVQTLLDQIYNIYGQFSAWKLRNLTHAESIWKTAYKKVNKEISQDEMKRYFKTLLK